MRPKIRLKMKNRPSTYDINGPRHGHKYTKYKYENDGYMY